MGSIVTALLFLIKTAIDLYVFVLLLRILLRLVSIDAFNPINQFAIRLTNAPLLPLQKVIPRFKDLDIPALVLAIILKIIKVILITLLMGRNPHLVGAFLWATFDLLDQLFTFYFYLIILTALFSWFAHFYQTPVTYLLFKLTEPLLAQCRKLIPPLGGFDLSPLAALFALQLISMLLITPFLNTGVRLTFG